MKCNHIPRSLFQRCIVTLVKKYIYETKTCSQDNDSIIGDRPWVTCVIRKRRLQIAFAIRIQSQRYHKIKAWWKLLFHIATHYLICHRGWTHIVVISIPCPNISQSISVSYKWNKIYICIYIHNIYIIVEKVQTQVICTTMASWIIPIVRQSVNHKKIL